MLQKEVAERVVARPDTSAYGRLAVLCQWRSSARIAFEVNRNAFVPPPKVTSAVVHLTPGDMPPDVDVKKLDRLTADVFGQRRKILRASLQALPCALAALESCGFASAHPAETHTATEFTSVPRLLRQQYTLTTFPTSTPF